ncbi:zinc finger protein 32-like [Larimichthys crocea]|uniref:zinc finger protein 32-like n=1 Tax=Larimichthys crocea TaxID=215358 RepID=UPI000F604485|nr:zinc finger protein 32-like [Larimichthys crocea]
MSKVRMLRIFVNQRLSAAAEEILALFERTIAEYEEEIRRQRLLQAGGPGGGPGEGPGAGSVFTVIKEVPPEQKWSPVLDPDPKPPHIKEEHEDLWTNQEGELTFTPVPVKKSEDEEEEEEARSSQLHHRQTKEIQTEADGEDCGGPEPASRSDPDASLEAVTRDQRSPSSETEHGSAGLQQVREPQPPLTAFKVPGGDAARRRVPDLQIHMRCPSAERTFPCPFCGKKFSKNSNLTTHLRVHTGEKPFTCSVCSSSFSLRCTLVNHMRVHTGEKPFSCSVCSKSFSKKANLTTHMALHADQKPFRCRTCDRRFTWHSQVKNHKCVCEAAES